MKPADFDDNPDPIDMRTTTPPHIPADITINTPFLSSPDEPAAAAKSSSSRSSSSTPAPTSDDDWLQQLPF